MQDLKDSASSGPNALDMCLEAFILQNHKLVSTRMKPLLFKTKNSRSSRHQAPQKALPLIIHIYFPLQKTYKQQFSNISSAYSSYKPGLSLCKLQSSSALCPPMTLFTSVFWKPGAIFYLLLRTPHIMELSRKYLAKGNNLLKVEKHISSLKPKSGPLFDLCVPQFAVHLLHYHGYATSLRFGQISNVPPCSQSLQCFRIWNTALKTPVILLSHLSHSISYSHFPLSVGV